MQWIILKHQWHECYLSAMPHLMHRDDSLELVAPLQFAGRQQQRGETTIVLGAERCPETWAKIAQAPEILCYETENVLARSGLQLEASARARMATGGRPWLNYSRANARVFGDLPLAPRLTADAPEESSAEYNARPIDVLFVGSLNERRTRLLTALSVRLAQENRAPIAVAAPGGATAFGPDFTRLLRSSKVVVNVHFYEPGVFESFRVVPAVAAGCQVISEVSVDGEGEDLSFVENVPYDEIVKSCLQALPALPLTSA